jgi:hypothetical protein
MQNNYHNYPNITNDIAGYGEIMQFHPKKQSKKV